MGKKVAEYARELADREAIRECIARAARGGDRIDRDLMQDTIWPDATDDHGGPFAGNRLELIDQQMIPILRSITRTSHMIGNMLIEIDGDRANVETYMLGSHDLQDLDEPKNVILGARYLDTLEKRDDEWRILKRVLINDWCLNIPSSGEWAQARWGWRFDGGRKPDDPSYAAFRAGENKT